MCLPYLSVCLSVCVSIYVSACLSLCLSVCCITAFVFTDLYVILTSTISHMSNIVTVTFPIINQLVRFQVPFTRESLKYNSDILYMTLTQLPYTTVLTLHIILLQAVYVPADDLTDPAPATTFAHLDATTVLSRQVISKK